MRLARHALETHFGVATEAPSTAVRTPNGVGGVFATLKRDGELRGCIGYVLPNIDLQKRTARAVVAAATDDPRFHGVEADELSRIRISILVLAEPVPVDEVGEIEIGRDGLVIERDGARASCCLRSPPSGIGIASAFSPKPCVKAGLAPDSWKGPRNDYLALSRRPFRRAVIRQGGLMADG